MIKKYIKIPTIFEVIQFTGDNTKELINWVNQKQPPCIDNSIFILFTLIGKYNCEINDYIIKDADGIFYACKPERFKLNYKEV